MDQKIDPSDISVDLVEFSAKENHRARQRTLPADFGPSSPWRITGVELDLAHSEIRVPADHPRGTKFCCPDCDTELPCHDYAEKWDGNILIHVNSRRY